MSAAVGGGSSQEHGWARAFGWWCFLALIVLTPIVVGAFPTQLTALERVRANDPVGIPKTVAVIVLAGLSFCGFCVSVIRRESEVYWHQVLWLLVGLCGWASVSTAFALSPALAVWGTYARNEGLVAIISYVLVAFLAIQYVRSIRALRVVMISAVGSAAFVSVYALGQRFGIDFFDWVGEVSRVTSTFGNADMLGNYLVFALAVALGLAFSAEGKRSTVVLWCATAVIGLALAATLTRGAWLGAVVVLLAFAFCAWYSVWSASRQRKIAFVVIAVVLLVVVGIAIVVSRPAYGGQGSVLTSGLARATNGRTVIWSTAIRGWLVHPFLGWGPDGFARAFDRAVAGDWYALVPAEISVDSAHSIFIQTLVTLGIPGLILMLWSLGRTAKESFNSLSGLEGRTRMLLAGLWAALVGQVAALALGVTMPEVTVWLWLTVGLLLASASSRVAVWPKGVLALGAVLGVVMAVWAGSWLAADYTTGRAIAAGTGAEQIAGLETAVRLNPLAQEYKWLLAEALATKALDDRKSGENAQAVDALQAQALEAYESASAADRGNVLVRLAYARYLLYLNSASPNPELIQRAIRPTEEALSLSPVNAQALVTAALVYQAAGRPDDARKAEQLARSVAPAYSIQTLGPPALESTPAP